jgi:hypothetical protein
MAGAFCVYNTTTMCVCAGAADSASWNCFAQAP